MEARRQSRPCRALQAAVWTSAILSAAEVTAGYQAGRREHLIPVFRRSFQVLRGEVMQVEGWEGGRRGPVQRPRGPSGESRAAERRGLAAEAERGDRGDAREKTQLGGAPREQCAGQTRRADSEVTSRRRSEQRGQMAKL